MQIIKNIDSSACAVNMAVAAAHSTSQFQSKLQDLAKELESKNAQLRAVQRNYVAVTNILHERLKLLDEASQQLLTERTDAEQLKGQLATTISRAHAAEQLVKQASDLPDQLLRLQQELTTLRVANVDEHQHCRVLQEQISRLKQDLFANANSKQQLVQQLQEQNNLWATSSAAVSSLKQQLDDEKAARRAVTSELHALRDVLACSTAHQEELEKQQAAWQARTKAAEDQVAVTAAHSSRLQQDLANTKGSHATSAVRLLEAQTNQQLLEEKLTRASQALAVGQAAKVNLEQQVHTLQVQLKQAQQRAEAAEAAAAASSISLVKAQQGLDQARAAQFAAEQQCMTADATSKLVTKKLTEFQQQAARDQAVADACQKELREQISSNDALVDSVRQQLECWKFRQLEFVTRVVSQVDKLESRVQQLDTLSKRCELAVSQQEQQQQSQQVELQFKLTDWSDTVDQLSAIGGRCTVALLHLQQQWMAKQQQLRSASMGAQMLQAQVYQLEQHVSVAEVMERKLRTELTAEQLAREADQANARQQLESFAKALAAAEGAAATAHIGGMEQQTAVAKLETKLATAECDLVALRYQLASRDRELIGVSGDVKAAACSLQRLAGAATEAVHTLQGVGALQPPDAAMLLPQLSALAERACTSSRPGSPLTARHRSQQPSTAAGAIDSRLVSSSSTNSAADTSVSGSAGNAAETSATAGNHSSTENVVGSMIADGDSTVATSAATTADGQEAQKDSTAATPANKPAPPDPAVRKQLLNDLSCLQHTMQVIMQAVQHLAAQVPKQLGLHEEIVREVVSTAAKLLHVEESLASNHTCLVCMRVFSSPVAVVPCGHNYCKSCNLATGGKCRECGSTNDAAVKTGTDAAILHDSKIIAVKAAPDFIPAPALEHLCAKHVYKLSMLKGLHQLLAQKHQNSMPAAPLA